MAEDDDDYTDEASEAMKLPTNDDRGEVVNNKGRPGRLPMPARISAKTLSTWHVVLRAPQTGPGRTPSDSAKSS